MRRAFQVYQTADGHWQRDAQNPGDTLWHVSMPAIDQFCAAMSNIQDELASTLIDTGVNQTGINLSAQGFMSQIFQFDTGPYNSFENGDGPATKAQRIEALTGHPTARGGGSNTKRAKVDPIQVLITLYVFLLNLSPSSQANSRLIQSAEKATLRLIQLLKAQQITPKQALAEAAKIEQSLE